MPSFASTITSLRIAECALENRDVVCLQPAWGALDKDMRKVFASYLQQYEQGLIHSCELLDGLMAEYHKQRV